jgi:hypothetical protein
MWYAPIETSDQLGHDPSSMNSQPINDRRAENERWAIDSDNGANEFHGAPEDSLATMNHSALPFQQQIGLYQDAAAPVQIQLEGVSASIVDRT